MAVQELCKKIKIEQFLIFYLDGEKFAFPVLNLNGVVGMPQVSPQNKIVDLIVLRIKDQIVPVFHLKPTLNLSEIEYNEKACVVLIQVKNKTESHFIGLVVDAVEMICEIPLLSINKYINHKTKINKKFITGLVKVGDDTITILNIDKLINTKEIAGFFEE